MCADATSCCKSDPFPPGWFCNNDVRCSRIKNAGGEYTYVQDGYCKARAGMSHDRNENTKVQKKKAREQQFNRNLTEVMIV